METIWLLWYYIFVGPRRKQENIPNIIDIMNEDNVAQNENKCAQGDMQNVGSILKVEKFENSDFEILDKLLKETRKLESS